MKGFCSFLSVIPLKEAENRGDVYVVENCNVYDAELTLAVVLEHSKIDAIKRWVKEEHEVIGNYVCEALDAGDLQLACVVLQGNEKIEYFTTEFVKECGGIQEFINRYGAPVNPIVFSDDSTEDKKDEEPLDSFDDSSVNDLSPKEYTEDVEAVEIQVDRNEEVTAIVGSASESNDVMIELPKEIAGRSTSIPFNSLVDLANFINEASETLEKSEFSDSYILQRDSLGYAVEYVDKFSPTFLKEFMKNYVESAESDTDLIRITKMLDSLVNYATEKKVRV